MNIFWNGGNPNIKTRTNLPHDIYSVLITNSNGCSDALTIELIAPIEIEFITIIKEEVCFGDESGTIRGLTLMEYIGYKLPTRRKKPRSMAGFLEIIKGLEFKSESQERRLKVPR
jgi:hypothetical protein